MNDHPVHRDDITALRNDGDLKAYMRSLLRPTRKPEQTPETPRPTNRPPGAWPPGTSPPGPPPDWNHPPEAWAAAVRRYRTEQRHQLDQEDQP